MELIPARKAKNVKKPAENHVGARLATSLREADGFCLYFVICDSRDRAEKLKKETLNLIDRPIEFITIHKDENLLETLQSFLPRSPQNSIFYISGLENLVATLEEGKEYEVLEMLEYQQDEFIDLNHPLVFILPSNIALTLQESAPEFWSWNKGVLETEKRLSELQPRSFFISEFFSDAFGAESYQKKQELLLIYKSLLAEFDADSTLSSRSSPAELAGKIGLLLFELGDYPEAKVYFDQQLSFLKSEGNDYLIVCALNNIGKVYESQGLYEYAMGYMKRALKRGEQVLKKKPYLKALLLNNIGWVYYLMGQQEKALEYCTEALDIGEMKLGNRDPRLAPILFKVGNLFRLIGENEEALEYFRRILQLVEEGLGLDHPYVASVMHCIGMVYKNQENYQEALNYLYRWMEGIEESVGPAHPYVALQINDIGMVYCDQKNYQKALKYFKWALQIRKETMGTKDPFVGKIYASIGKAYLHLKEYNKAQIELERALTILELKLPENHPDIVELIGLLNEIERNRN